MRLALALLILAAPAAAQSTDALIDRVVQRQHIGDLSGTPFGAYPTGFDGLDSTAVIDSVRAAFTRDARPDLLREALAYLDRPDAVRFERRTRLNTPTEAALTAAMTAGAPKKGSLADSLLAGRYLRALGTDSFMVSVMNRVMDEALAQATAAAGDPPDASSQQGIEFMRAIILGVLLPQIDLSTRLSISGAAQPDVEAFIAFAESPPGRYVRQTTLAGIRAAVLVRLDAAMSEAAQDRPDGPALLVPKSTGPS